jgi:hypothetical protein
MRTGFRRIAPAIALLLLVTGLISSAQARLGAQEPQADPSAGGLTTPQLIDAALARGEIDQDTANLYLAYALSDYEKLPARYRSDVPWSGTVPLLRLQESVQTMQPGATRASIKALLADSCGSSDPLPFSYNSVFFHIEYTHTIGGGLTYYDYAVALDQAWIAEVIAFNWAAPPVYPPDPPPGNRYYVRIENLGGGLLGCVAPGGAHSGLVGDNPNTTWDDVDAIASHMVLDNDYSEFATYTPQQYLDSVAAHELNHSIQFGYGALTGPNAPDESFYEGSAVWMEDEVSDSSNASYRFLWPYFWSDSCMGEYDGSYSYWITFRGLTERYGTGVAGGGEQVMQDFWEETSKSSTSNMLPALNTALVNRGTTLAEAYHAYAIAVKFNKTCGGGYVLPYCFEEAAGYVAAAGETVVHGSISSVGGRSSYLIEDNYDLKWISLPTSGGPYTVTLTNWSDGGLLRGSVVCDTGSELTIHALPDLVGPYNSSALTDFDPSGCTSVVAVLTNESQTADNPSSCTGRLYWLRTDAGSTSLPVDSLSDPGNGLCEPGGCTLREAVAIAASGDTITFSPSLAGDTITLGSEITLDKDLTIDGSGLSSPVRVSGGDGVRVFRVTEGVSVTINHLDIRDGHAISGGGIDVFSSTVTVSNSTFSDNSADDGGAINVNNGELLVTNSSFFDNHAGVYGGAINNNVGSVSIFGSTFSGNSSDQSGGAIFNNLGNVEVTNSTLSGNSATDYGGGLLNYEGGMKIENSTISGNSASSGGGGILSSSNSVLLLYNSIVANSPSGGDCAKYGILLPTPNIHNLIEDGSCNAALTGDPLLLPLADNGGPTQTMALQVGSPAINAGDAATCQATDQRGVSRPQGAPCDVGAYEISAVYLPLVVR